MNAIYTAAVITVSDRGYRGEREDQSGPMLRRMLADAGWNVVYKRTLPDERAMIQDELIACADRSINLVLTTGGTGFSPRDITPEATLAVIERETRGIPEAMRAESMRITPRGCLSRAAAGIRGNTLIVNLPGSPKAAKENLEVVLPALRHGIEMLCSSGSADCAVPLTAAPAPPSLDRWMDELKASPESDRCGMYLAHRGVVRKTAKAEARHGQKTPCVRGMTVTYDPQKLEQAIERTRKMPGIVHVRAWIHEGELRVGDDIMLALVAGDIRPNVVHALETLVEELKTRVVSETEIV